MKKIKDEKVTAISSREKMRRYVESTATFGLLLVAIGLATPFVNLTDAHFVSIFKWIYAPGALIYTISRIVGSTDPADSMRIRRLRRLEFWAGIAFCVGAFFWFWNEDHWADILRYDSGTMLCLRETVVFTLVGALIQVIASWLITSRRRKENRQASENTEK